MVDFNEHLNKKLKDPEFRTGFNLESKILEISVKLIKTRHEKGLSQATLARNAGITQQQLSKLENGYNSNIITYIKVAYALKLDIKIE